jgi:long-chain acyl-CoA synthetase
MERVWYKSYDPNVPRSLEYPDQCLPLLLENSVRRFPQNVATEFLGAKLTYQDLWGRIQSLATAFTQMGVKPGTKVAIMLPNCPQTIIVYYATLWIGGLVVLTNPMYVEREMEHQWNDSEAEFLVVLDHLYPKVEKLLPRTNIRTVVVTSLREYLPFLLKWLYPIKAQKDRLFTAVPYSDAVLNFSQIINKASPSPPSCSVKLDDLALLQYTGGTTGVSKGVMLSHRNILANVIQATAWLQDVQWGQERFLSILPIFHIFGMTSIMNWPLYLGCTAILVPRFEVNQFLKILHKSKPTIFPGVPTIYVALVNHPKIQSYDLSSIRYCVTGSAPMPVEILKKFESLTGGIIVEGYGLSEASPITHVNPIMGMRKPGSIGLPLPDTDYKIVDLETGDRELPAGEDGELVVRGPQVMQGYWKMPEETANALRDGWLHTGDIAYRDEDGYVFIVDRKKDMIIAGGFNIYPREIDEVLYTHPKILDAVAVGVPDPYRGETLKAFVVPKPGESLTEEEIIEFCKSNLAAYKVPKMVEFRDSLPKTIVGKILRKELRAEEIAKQARQEASEA